MRALARASVFLFVFSIGCDQQNTSDSVQRQQSERLLAEATSQVGMPSIKNFRERKILKDIYELRDQEGLVTYTYVYNEHTGRFKFFGETIGYGVPFSTQFTNPQKIERFGTGLYEVLPQADPNALFAPTSSTATWILMMDPKTKKAVPVYVEPLITVSPFKLPGTVADYGPGQSPEEESAK